MGGNGKERQRQRSKIPKNHKWRDRKGKIGVRDRQVEGEKVTEIDMRKEIVKQRRDKKKEGKQRSQIWKKPKRQRRSHGGVAIRKGKICGQRCGQRDMKSSTVGEKRNTTVEREKEQVKR